MTDTRQRVRLDGRDTEAVVTDEMLILDQRPISWLDVDRLDEGDHRLTLHLGDGTAVTMSHTGATHDRFVDDLRRRRRRVRFPALTAATGDPLESWVSRDPAGHADVHLFDRSLVVEARSGDVTVVPLSLLDRVDRDGHSFVLRCRGLDDVTVRALGQATDRFAERLDTVRRALLAGTAAAYAELDADLSGLVAPDGWAVDAVEAGRHWPTLIARMSAGERSAEFELLRDLSGDRLRIGLWTEGGSTAMPFVLAPVGDVVAVEAVETDARATFVFRSTDVGRVNAALVLTGFRRDALSLPDDRLGRWATAARTSAPVQWARRAFVARVVHDAGWADGVRRALSTT